MNELAQIWLLIMWISRFWFDYEQKNGNRGNDDGGDGGSTHKKEMIYYIVNYVNAYIWLYGFGSRNTGDEIKLYRISCLIYASKLVNEIIRVIWWFNDYGTMTKNDVHNFIAFSNSNLNEWRFLIQTISVYIYPISTMRCEWIRKKVNLATQIIKKNNHT